MPTRLARAATGIAVGALIGLLVKELNLPSVVSWWHGHTPVVLGVTLVAALLWWTRLRGLVIATAVALGALWLVVAETSVSSRLAAYTTRSDGPCDADAVFVFASSLQPDGDPTTEAMSRLLRGLEMVGQKHAPRLVLSELRAPGDTYGALARRWMASLHLDFELVTVGPVQNTHDEAVAVAALARERGWHRVLAVSSPLHLRRAAATLEHEGLQVCAVPSQQTRYDVEQLTQSDDRLTAFADALHDLLGGWVYRRRGWIR